MRAKFKLAFTSMTYPLLLRRCRCTAAAAARSSTTSRSRQVGFLLSVTVKSTGGCELTELVANHIFSRVYGNKFTAVMHSEGQPNCFGHNRRAARPSFDHFFVAIRFRGVDFFRQMVVDKRTFFY